MSVRAGSPVIKKIIKFFGVKGYDFLVLKQDTGNGNTRYVIKFGKPLKVTGAKYDKFYDFLTSLGFYLTYNEYKTLADCPGCECSKWVELYKDDDGSEVSVEYIDEEIKGKSEVYIERIEILATTGR
jgi:hypothetical protein